MVAALVATSSCGFSTVNEFGDDAKANFMQECLQETTIVEGEEPLVEPLGTEPYCECVYVEMQDRFGLTFDELKEYEDELAKAATDGGDVPTPPEDFTKAVDFCSTSGPTPEVTEPKDEN